MPDPSNLWVMFFPEGISRQSNEGDFEESLEFFSAVTAVFHEALLIT